MLLKRPAKAGLFSTFLAALALQTGLFIFPSGKKALLLG
jgi:hypothetical protein